MFSKLLRRMAGQKLTDPKAVTAERLRHFFEWSEACGYTGTGIPHRHDLAGSIRIEREPRTIVYRKDFGPYKTGQTRHIPAHIEWIDVRVGWAQISLTDGVVEFHYAPGGKAMQLRKASSGQAAQIAGFFEDWYAFLQLPGSIQTLRDKAAAKAARQRPNESKIETIQRYLSGELTLEDLWAIDNALMAVDWRASDDEIVSACEDRIATGKLSAEFAENDGAVNVIITYGKTRTKVTYPAPEADRDTTLQMLNKAISRSHDIRYLLESAGNDTAEFLPLKHAEWAQLERQFPAEVEAKFRRLEAGQRIFA